MSTQTSDESDYVVAARKATARGDWSEARTHMARALDAEPNNAEFHALMGWYTYRCAHLESHERQRLTRHHLDTALAIDPANVWTNCCNGMVMASEGNQGRARWFFENSLKSDPSFNLAEEGLARLDRGPKQAAAVEPTFLVMRRTRGRAKVIVAAAVLFMVAIGAAYFHLHDPTGARKKSITMRIGTKLAVDDAQESDGIATLAIPQKVWDALAPAQRQTELRTIRDGMPGARLRKVTLFGDKEVIAIIDDGEICVGSNCR